MPTILNTLTVGSTKVHGTTTLADMMTDVGKLRMLGFCLKQPTNTCSMAGSGYFKDKDYKYRIQVGSKVIHGTDDQIEFFRALDGLKTNGFCKMQ